VILNLNKNLFQKSFSTLCKDKTKGLHLAGFVSEGALIDIFQAGDQQDQVQSNYANIKFPIASMTKVFTACCILKLRDQGKLDLDAPISKTLKIFTKSPWTEISIRHLLTMNAGLPYDLTITHKYASMGAC